MSAQVISELFQQIVHSEEKIKQRFEALKKVNQDILDHQEQLLTVQYETETLQNNLTLATNKLVEEEIELKWLNMRENILREQEQESCEENRKLDDEITRLEKQQSSDRVKFLADCDQFLGGYDLSDSTDSVLMRYEENLKEEFIILKEKHQNLKDRSAVFEDARQKMENLREEKEKLIMDLKSQDEKNNEMKELLKCQQKELETTKHTKENVSKKSATSKEWQNLTSELEASKREEKLLSDQHQELATELYQLQQCYMQDEFRKKQVQAGSNAWSVNNNASGNAKSRAGNTKKLFKYKAVKNSRKANQKLHGRSNGEDLISSEELDSLDFEFHDDGDDSLLDFARKTSS